MKIKRMFSAAKKAAVLELFVYDTIGEDWYGGISPQLVADAIKAAEGFDSITVHINSPGGSSFDGVAIHNLIRQQKVPVTVIVEGVAASAAFTVAMAGDTVQVCDGAMLMLHNAWTFASGDARELRSTADLLDKVSGTLRDIYSKASGLSAEDVAALMDAETWLTAEEAVTKGFANEALATTPEKNAAAKALIAKFNLSKFCAKVPEKFKAAGDDGCECPCSECVTGNCEQCSHDGCDCDGCEECGQQMEAKGPQLVITVPRNLPAADLDALRTAIPAIAAAVREGKPIVVPEGVTLSAISGAPSRIQLASAECKCTCESCVKDDCRNCTVADCQDANCEHQAKAQAPADPDAAAAEAKARATARLALREREQQQHLLELAASQQIQ